MHGVLLRPDGSSLSIPQADQADVTLPHGQIYRGVQLIDNYGQRYWIYLLFHDPTAPSLRTREKP